uniref:Uncharacterized protein n=1 Tax=Arundo donax TaxID=35708 RepID=A0A0A9F0V6_ARUDO
MGDGVLGFRKGCTWSFVMHLLDALLFVQMYKRDMCSSLA